MAEIISTVGKRLEILRNIQNAFILRKSLEDSGEEMSWAEFNKMFKGCAVYTAASLQHFDDDLKKAIEGGFKGEELEKAMKDRSKLTKKIIYDKNGKKQTVYVNADKEKASWKGSGEGKEEKNKPKRKDVTEETYKDWDDETLKEAIKDTKEYLDNYNAMHSEDEKPEDVKQYAMREKELKLMQSVMEKRGGGKKSPEKQNSAKPAPKKSAEGKSKDDQESPKKQPKNDEKSKSATESKKDQKPEKKQTGATETKKDAGDKKDTGKKDSKQEGSKDDKKEDKNSLSAKISKLEKFYEEDEEQFFDVVSEYYEPEDDGESETEMFKNLAKSPDLDLILSHLEGLSSGQDNDFQVNDSDVEHPDGVKQGGLSKKVWESPAVQGYSGGFGHLYHEGRSHEADKQLETALTEAGLDHREIGAFLTSKHGRYALDQMTGKGGEVKKDGKTTSYIKKLAEEFKKDLKKMGGIDKYESGEGNEE